MSTNHHTALVAGTSRYNATEMNAPLAELDQAITDIGGPGTGRDADITLFPEYQGAVLSADGGNNDPGTLGMTSDSEVVSNVRKNYYQWNSDAGTLQDYDIHLKIPIPYDFDSFQVGVSVALTVDIKTEENATTNNKIDITLQKDGSATTSALTAQKSAVAATWVEVGFDETDAVLADLAAGDVLNISLKLYSNAKYARVGKINLKVKRL